MGTRGIIHTLIRPIIRTDFTGRTILRSDTVTTAGLTIADPAIGIMAGRFITAAVAGKTAHSSKNI